MILISSFFDIFCVFFQGKVVTSCNLDTTDYFVLYSFILIIQNPLLHIHCTAKEDSLKMCVFHRIGLLIYQE